MVQSDTLAMPAWRDGAVAYHALHGIDRQIVGSRHLFFAGDATLLPDDSVGLSAMRAGEWLGGGTFRNSLYVAPWSQLTDVRDLRLIVDASGDVRVRVGCAVKGRAVDTLAEVRVCGDTRSVRALALPAVTDLPQGARLFWHVDALAPSCVHELAFATRTPPRRQPRLAILMRTFGRGADVRALLDRFADAARQGPRHAAALDRMAFWLLDSTASADAVFGDGPAAQARHPLPALNLRVIRAPNLGGGGNASHLARLFLDHCADRADAPDEVLILDDDLSISFESLARYLAFCGWRSRDVVCSLPLLMQSRPTTVWEDGGLWGRLHAADHQAQGGTRSLFPTLLKHGVSLDGYDKLDDFGPLNAADYATFVFFGLPRAALERIGLPAAFFLRGDDIELSLRARAQGLPLFTNPNLAAWHEPGHSHAQEYMAILHAAIINLSHSSNTADAYLRFFEERLYEHAAIDDLAGLAVYLAVIEELVSDDSSVLTPHFAPHYPQALAALEKHADAAGTHRLPELERERLEARTRDGGGQVLPFLHAGYHRHQPGGAPLLLVNASRGEYRQVRPAPFAHKADSMARFVLALARLEQTFDLLRSRWRERLAHSGSHAFWCQVRDAHAGQTGLVAASIRTPVPRTVATIDAAVAMRRPSSTASPSDRMAPDAGPLSLNDVRERLERELRDLQALRHQHADAGGLNRGRIASAPRQSSGAWPRWLAAVGGWWPDGLAASARGARRQRANDPPIEPLPADFVAEEYLAMNVDVARSGLDAATHYLHHGRREGRRYRRPGDASLIPAYRKT